MSEKPVSVPQSDMIRVTEAALALIGSSLAGAGGRHLVDEMQSYWESGELHELTAMLEKMRRNLPTERAH